MNNELKIFIDRLDPGKEEEVSFSISPDFLEIKEQELIFPHPIEIEGKISVTNENVLLHLKAKTSVKMPCAICNQIISIPLEANDIFYSLFLEEFKEAVFDYSPLVREELLLQVPLFAECKEGQCPERENISAYLKKTTSAKKNPADHTHFPFADL